MSTYHNFFDNLSQTFSHNRSNQKPTTIWVKTILTAFFLMLMLWSYAQLLSHQKTNWSVAEVKDWAEKHKTTPAWNGRLLYQGSDSITHHFISRVMDQWIFININRTDLFLKEEKQYKKTSSSRLGYYYVDATKEFAKIKDF